MGSLNAAALDDVVNKITGGNNGNPETLWWFKDDRVGAGTPATAVLGRMISLWTQNGFPGSSGAAPGTTPRQCTSATQGAIPFTNPGGGRDKYLLGLSGASVAQGAFFLYDRLADVSGLDATNVGVQQFAGGASLTPPRYTSGRYVVPFLEIYNTVGSTTTMQISYTNDQGVSGRVSTPTRFGAAGQSEIQRMLPIGLAAGDFGVQSVQSCQLASSTGTVGDFGFTLARVLAIMPALTIGAATIRDLLTYLTSIVKIETSACLALAWTSTVTAGNAHAFGHLQTVEV